MFEWHHLWDITTTQLKNHKKSFGELDYETPSDKEFKEFLHSLNVTTGSLAL